MGLRLRLKSTFDISGYSKQNQVILTALKKYGMILADNGSAVYISGAPDDRWNNDDLHRLGNLTANDFEVVQMSHLYTPVNVPTGKAPTIASFTANPAAPMAGQVVTLSWSVSNSEYNIVTPQAGAVRGNSVILTPPAGTTTTYTLEATNEYGRTKKTVTITAH